MTTGPITYAPSRREATLSALAAFAAAAVMGWWAARLLSFPRPEDVAYYVGVARNLVEGRGLVSDAIWSFQTPPLVLPRPAFEVWLPLPTFLAAAAMAVAGSTFAVAQLSSIAALGIVGILAWRLALDVAVERRLSPGRARAVAVGSGITTAVSLPLVVAAAQPDSTMPFAMLVLAACLVMNRLMERPSLVRLAALGLLLGLASLTRNEVVWLGLAWAVVAWPLAQRIGGTAGGARAGSRTWLQLVAAPAFVAFALYVPWAVREWLTFGSPLPGQTLTNALSLDGRDIFAWRDRPTLDRYLAAGLPQLVALRWTGLLHNLSTLLVLGAPTALIGVLGLPIAARLLSLRPLVVYAVATFAVATLAFPVSSTWGTFLHAAGAIHVLLVISALLALDVLIDAARRRRNWTRPVSWLAPALTVTTGVLLATALLPAQGRSAVETAARYDALPPALARGGAPLTPGGPPVITDFPIWFAETTRHPAIALPNEPPSSILDLADHFGAQVLIVDASDAGIWPEVLESGADGSECFTPIPLPPASSSPSDLEGLLAYQISCP